MTYRQALTTGLSALMFVLLPAVLRPSTVLAQSPTPFPLPSPQPDRATITIMKDSVPDAFRDFSFGVWVCPPPGQLSDCVVFNGVVLDDDDNPSLSNSISFGVIDYEVTIVEDPAPGGKGSAISCDTATEVDVTQSFVRLRGLPAQQFTCVFRNELTSGIATATPLSTPAPTPPPDSATEPILTAGPSPAALAAVLPASLPQTGADYERGANLAGWIVPAVVAAFVAALAFAARFV